MIMAFRYLEAYISESEGDFRWVNMYIILPPPKKTPVECHICLYIVPPLMRSPTVREHLAVLTE